eukprot:11169977-Heterocapsa_arctica.AAC.1
MSPETPHKSAHSLMPKIALQTSGRPGRLFNPGSWPRIPPVRNHVSPFSGRFWIRTGPMRPPDHWRPGALLGFSRVRPFAIASRFFAEGADHRAFPSRIQLDNASLPVAPSGR